MPIAKVDLDQLLNQARVTLTGVSEGGLKGALYDTFSEFLNDSSIWTQDIFISTQIGVQQYPLFVPEGQIIRLVGVNDVGPSIPAPGTIPVHVSPISALMANVGVLTVRNAPQTSSVYCATVVTNVAQPVDKHGMAQAPDWLLPIWHVGILDGLLGKLMLQPNKSYTDKAQAAYHLKRFRDAISRARVSKLRANTNNAQAWRFPQQFRSAIGSANERSF